MKLPRDLAGEELVKLLCKHFGYVRIHQEGSHIVLQTLSPRQHRLAVPNHNPLRLGTLNAILRSVAGVKGVSKEDVLRYL
jgi:predicted RNA binding protein YcfA (HicA-like mRNA interferase family)